MRRVKLTAEYIGGVMVGLGLGVGIMAAIFQSPLYYHFIIVLGLGLISLGSAIVMHIQNRYTEDFPQERKTQP